MTSRIAATLLAVTLATTLPCGTIAQEAGLLPEPPIPAGAPAQLVPPPPIDPGLTAVPRMDATSMANPAGGMAPNLTMGQPSHASPGGNPANAAFYVPQADAPATGVPPAPVAGPPPIAGLTPWQRPEGAPRLIDFPKTEQWYADALHGVSEPYPGSLDFLQDEGAWWTPFIHPGMVGPYDIRGWHHQGG